MIRTIFILHGLKILRVKSDPLISEDYDFMSLICKNCLKPSTINNDCQKLS